MITGATLATLLVVLLAGQLVLGLTGAGAGRGRLERLALASLAGLAAVAFGVTLLGHLGPLGRGRALALALVLGAGGLATLVRGAGASPIEAAAAPGGPARPWTALERLALGLVLAFSAFTVFYAASMPMHSFDPTYHFAYKGKLLLHEGLLGPGWTDLEGPVGRVITHPDYPPGVGALEALLGALGGGFDEHAARPLFALFALATTALLYSSLVRRSRRAAVTASLLWASLPFLFYSRLPHPSWGKAAFGLFAGPTAGRARFGASGGSDRWSMPDGWSLDGAGDLPLAALFSAGVLLLILHLARDRGERAAWGEPVLAGLLLGGGALMKNEGLALLAVAALALGPWGLWMARSRGGLRSALVPLALALGTALVVAGPWLAVRGEVPTIGEDYPSRLSPAGLVEAWGASQPVLTDLDGAAPYERRVPALVARGFASALTSVPRFGLVWLLFGLGLLVGLLRPRRFLDSPALPAALAVLGAFALYALVLLVTPWNLSSLFKTAIPDRLVLHVAPLAIFATALLLAGRSSATTPASAGSAEEDPEAVRGTDREPGS